MFIKDLISLGLSEKEAKIYVSLLELEVASANKIALNSGVNRSSVYMVLDSLIRKGMVANTENNSVQKYSAISPEVFLKSAEESLERARVKLVKTKGLIPKLKSLHKDTSNRPTVRVFEGEEGLIHILEESLNDSSEKFIRLFSSAKNILRLRPEYLTSFRKKRLTLGVKQRAILADNELSHKLFPLGKDMYEVVFIPKNKYPFPVDLAIVDNTIGYLTINRDKMISVVIENHEIAEVMKVLFDIAWKEAERIGKKN